MIVSALKIFVTQIEPEMELSSKREEYSEISKFRGAISKSYIVGTTISSGAPIFFFMINEV